jgi:threonine aldolase
MFGGAMRQTGVYAAAGLYALEHHYDRLSQDHDNARMIARRLAASPRIHLDLATVQTNIVIFHLAEDAPAAEQVVARARDEGVLVFAFGPRTIRAVTHYDVSGEECERGAEILAWIADGG